MSETNEENKEKNNDCGDGSSAFETGSITVEKSGHFIHCLTIIGQIEGHFILPSQNKTTKYEHVIPQLVAIEESKEIDGLLIILNTVGGDVEAGLAIACSRRRSFNRRSACRKLQKKLYRSERNNDGSPGANERHRSRRSANAVVF